MTKVNMHTNAAILISTTVPRLEQIIADALASGEGFNHYLSMQREAGVLTATEVREVLLYSASLRCTSGRSTYH